MLTARQRQVYELIVRSVSSKGYPPTIREIGARIGISSLRGVTCHLDALERKGWIKRVPTSRGISIVKTDNLEKFPQEGFIRVPLLGRIPAGTPNLGEEYVEAEVAIPGVVLGGVKGGAFLLRVAGDSMTGDHILDGDLIIVSSQQEVKNGDIVVANIDGETTVKRFYKDKGGIRLKASNPMYRDILLSKDFRIAGKVVGLLRRHR